MSTRILLPYFLAAFLLANSWSTSALAQWYYVASYEPYAAPMYYGYYPYYGYGGYHGYYGGYHPSTVVEGYLRGRAELIEARSIASLYYAQALKEREEARSQYLENRMAHLLYHAERRELRDQENARRREEQAQRREARHQLRAQQHADKRPLITWPAELMAESYEPIRTEIEALVKLRSELGNQAGEATRLAIRHAIRELAEQIVEDERAARLSEEESKSVRQFVRQLADEPTQPKL
jgi:hypothetical protein